MNVSKALMTIGLVVGMSHFGYAQTNTFPSSGNVGVGTISPQAQFTIYNTNAFDSEMAFNGQDHLLLSSINPGVGNYFGGITWKSGSRRRAGISAVMDHSDSDHVGLAFFTQGTDGPGPMFESMRISRSGRIGIGTTSPDEKLTVAGTVKSKEVIVEENIGADFVFEQGYELPDLSELETFIKSNKHLPEIPTANQMKEEGVKVGELQIKLLQKIEELTLYVIELKKENELIKQELKKIINK